MPGHEECDELDHHGPLDRAQAGQLIFGRATDPKPPELHREAVRVDPPQLLEELDERRAGCVGCPEEIVGGGSGPGGPGRIEERLDIARIAAECGAQPALGEAGPFEESCEPGPERRVIKHLDLLL